jgi:Ca2+/Na+ antiporter
VVVFPVAAGYVAVLAMPRLHVHVLQPLLGSVPHGFVEIPYDVSRDRPVASHESWLPVALLPVALGAVVGGSFVMVHEALAAQTWLHLPTAVVGTIVLAALTSLPNLWVALHFARTDRGTALFSSAMNSNTINLVGGLMIPTLFVGLASTKGSLPYFTWLTELTLLAVLAPLARSRLSRTAGAVIIAIYLVFVVLRVFGV